MKIFKYLFIALIVFIILIFLYKNYIYYLIPYNPFVEFSEDELKTFRFEEYNSFEPSESVHMKSNNLENNKLIFQYFRNLKLKPVRSNIIEEGLNGNIVYSMSFTFGAPSYGRIFINDLFLEEPSFFRISFSDNRLKNKEGYYQIIDSEFDLNYIKTLINNGEK
jgi:hypothetical protein